MRQRWVASRLNTLTSTDDKVVLRTHHLQIEIGEGPDVDYPEDRETVYAADLRTEQRWRLWTPRVLDETDVRSVLWLQLTSGRPVLEFQPVVQVPGRLPTGRPGDRTGFGSAPCGRDDRPARFGFILSGMRLKAPRSPF
jgi:hypothetical protein